MIDALIKIKEKKCDAFSFLPGDHTNKNRITIQGISYIEPGETLEGSPIGDIYDILLFEEGANGYHNYDEFEAILTCPYTYGDGIYKNDFYGLIAKKTTTSKEVVDLFRKEIYSYINNGEVDE